MGNLKKDLSIANKNIEKAIASVPRKLLLKEAKIAKKQLKSSNTHKSKLHELYKLTGELTDQVSVITPCRAGCSNCCNLNVTVSQLEAELISENLDQEIDISPLYFKTDFNGQPCSFLKDDKCSIYNVRPYMCRAFVSVMPNEYWCHSDRNLIVETPQLRFSELDKAYFSLEKGITKDIRQWFKA